MWDWDGGGRVAGTTLDVSPACPSSLHDRHAGCNPGPTQIIRQVLSHVVAAEVVWAQREALAAAAALGDQCGPTTSVLR